MTFLKTLDLAHLPADTLRLAAGSLANKLAPLLGNTQGDIQVVCTARDVDTFVEPFMSVLEERALGPRLRLHSAWNHPLRFGEHVLAAASRHYDEPAQSPADNILVVQPVLINDRNYGKPILSGSTTARTNLSHVLCSDRSTPKIWLVSAFASEAALEVVKEEFPREMWGFFRMITLASIPQPLHAQDLDRFTGMPEYLKRRRKLTVVG